ncbi:MAG: VWA domain-containing protein [Blastocatellia bacterium]
MLLVPAGSGAEAQDQSGSPARRARFSLAERRATADRPVTTRGQDPVPTPSPSPPSPPEKPAGPPPREDESDLDAESIRIESTLVVVPVSVTDQAGQPVRNLTAEDFLLREEGQQQQIQSLGDPVKIPLEMALLFDVSRSIRNRFEFEKEAASRFLQVVLKPGDAVTLFAIGQTSHLVLERTVDAAQAMAAIQSIAPSDEATAFYDTVSAAANYIESHAQSGARRVMVILSDGEDNNSHLSELSEATRATQASNSLFYAINPSGPSIRLNRLSIRGHDGMARLARETGGRAFLPDKLEDLTAVFAQIAAELEAQYLLGYYPTAEAKDGKFRRISVSVPTQPSLRIRAREGYYAAQEP